MDIRLSGLPDEVDVSRGSAVLDITASKVPSRNSSFNSGCRKRGMRTLENEDFHVELNKAIVHYHDWGQGMGKR